MKMQTIVQQFSQTAHTQESVEAAIASLREQSQQLRDLGVEKGSVQTYRPGRYRLHWRDESGKLKSSATIPAEMVGKYRADHQRWVQLQKLQRQIKRLEGWLDEFYQTA